MTETTLDIVADSYRYLNLNNGLRNVLAEDLPVVEETEARTYNECNIKSWTVYDDKLKTEVSLEVVEFLKTIYDVDVRSTGFYQFFEGDFLQPHVDRHGSLPGDYYTLLIPIVGTGVIKCYKENKDTAPVRMKHDYYNIMDERKTFTEIAELLVDRPVVFRPTKIIHAAVPVETPRVVWQTRFHSAPTQVETVARRIEECINVAYPI